MTDEGDRSRYETLNLRPGYEHEHNILERLYIGILPEDAAGANGTISLVVAQWPRYGPLQTLQLCLNDAEIGRLIRGLDRARRRLRRYRRQAQKEA
jgi:hypothetical protein